MTRTSLIRRCSATFCIAAIAGGLPLALAGCDKDVSTSKTSTTKTVDTPEGVKKTTETTEKKIETERKNP